MKIVSFKTAKIITQKCRDEYRNYENNSWYYDTDGIAKKINVSEWNENLVKEYDPDFVCDKLRGKHDLHITTKPYITEEGICFLFEIYGLYPEMFKLLKTKTGFASHYVALDAGIAYCYENIIK
jgi:hypothetical protein